MLKGPRPLETYLRVLPCDLRRLCRPRTNLIPLVYLLRLSCRRHRRAPRAARSLAWLRLGLWLGLGLGLRLGLGLGLQLG